MSVKVNELFAIFKALIMVSKVDLFLKFWITLCTSCDPTQLKY